MAHPVLETEECIGCGICVDACPQDVLEIAGGVVVVENEDACIACGDCVHHRDQRRLIQILVASEGPVFKMSAGPSCVFEPKGRFRAEGRFSWFAPVGRSLRDEGGLVLWNKVCAIF